MKPNEAIRLRQTIRDVPDFPKKGIIFKDITPVLQDAELCGIISNSFADFYRDKGIQAVVGIESRGFLFGLALSMKLGVSFVPVRKKGKLPFNKLSQEYGLEYGTDSMEIHEDAISPGTKVLIHDDLLATGGTASAAATLVSRLGGHVSGFAFIVELAFLEGRKSLSKHPGQVHSLLTY